MSWNNDITRKLNSFITYQYNLRSYKILGRPILHHLQQYQKMQYYDETDIYEIKWQKIKRLLWFSSQNVPYYKKKFADMNIQISNIKDIEDYENKIPILTKNDIKRNYLKLKSTKAVFPPLKKNSTGGSTGKPMNFWQDRYDRTHKTAINLLNWSWCGWKPFERIAYLWGATRDMEKKKNSTVSVFLNNKIFLNCFNLTEPKIYSYFNQILQFKPKLIVGYANSLYIFARFLQKHNLSLKKYNISVQSSAETLYPKKREVIEEIFGKNVFNSYGSREVATLAHECRFHSGLHIHEFVNHIEVLEKKEKFGKITVSNLTNLNFPFIRYQNEDIGKLDTKKKCKCGRSFRKLQKIYGRSSDFIKCPNGKFVHGEYFSHLLYSQDIISEFQIIQNSIEEIKINYVLSKNEPNVQNVKHLLNKLKQKILTECDNSLKIEFIELISITHLKSGKLKFVHSDLNFNF